MMDDAIGAAPAIGTRNDGAIFTVTLSNPTRMNAIDTAMWQAIPPAIAAAEADADIRVIVVQGDGTRAFSAGADISEFGDARSGANVADYDALNGAAFRAVANCAKPTIAKIAGYCMGGGFQLALSCDLRIVAEGAKFAIPAAKLGLGYNPEWLPVLLAQFSPSQAKDIFFTGRRFGHDEAAAFGLVTRLCALDDLDAATRSLASEIAANAPLTIAAAKRAIDALSRQPLPCAEELAAMARACFASADYAEGRAAFAAKRPPVFRGR